MRGLTVDFEVGQDDILYILEVPPGAWALELLASNGGLLARLPFEAEPGATVDVGE